MYDYNKEFGQGKYQVRDFSPLTLYIRVIPQGTVDNNYRARPFSRSQAGSRFQILQTTNPLIARPLSGSLNCAWYWVTLVLGQGIPPYSYFYCRASDIAVVGTTFNVFSYNAVWSENWTHNLPNAGRMSYQLCHRRGLITGIGQYKRI